MANEQDFRVAIVGCGWAGSRYDERPADGTRFSHAGAYADCPRTTVVAVCDADHGRANECAQFWGIASAYSNVEAMLREAKPDLVSVCTPDATHAAVIRTCLDCESVKGILAEKPLAMNPGDALDISAKARTKGVALAVNYSRRYSAAFKHLKSELDAGGIGAIQTVTGFYTKGLLHNGGHWIDLARYLLGDISFLETIRRSGYPADPEGDPTQSVRFHSDRGFDLVLLGLDASAYTIFEMDILGSHGRVRILDSGHRIERFGTSSDVRFPGHRFLSEPTISGGALGSAAAGAVTDLVSAVSDGISPSCSAEDGTRVIQLVAQVRASKS